MKYKYLTRKVVVGYILVSLITQYSG